MTSSEFKKIWNLMGELFPPSPKLKSKTTMIVWEKALSPYEMDAVVESCMKYARKNKFFPDIAEITEKLPQVDAQKFDEPDADRYTAIWRCVDEMVDVDLFWSNMKRKGFTYAEACEMRDRMCEGV